MMGRDPMGDRGMCPDYGLKLIIKSVIIHVQVVLYYISEIH